MKIHLEATDLRSNNSINLKAIICYRCNKTSTTNYQCRKCLNLFCEDCKDELIKYQISNCPYCNTEIEAFDEIKITNELTWLNNKYENYSYGSQDDSKTIENRFKIEDSFPNIKLFNS